MRSGSIEVANLKEEIRVEEERQLAQFFVKMPGHLWFNRQGKVGKYAIAQLCDILRPFSVLSDGGKKAGNSVIRGCSLLWKEQTFECVIEKRGKILYLFRRSKNRRVQKRDRLYAVIAKNAGQVSLQRFPGLVGFQNGKPV